MPIFPVLVIIFRNTRWFLYEEAGSRTSREFDTILFVENWIPKEWKTENRGEVDMEPKNRNNTYDLIYG